jgi:hypothetical protein
MVRCRQSQNQFEATVRVLVLLQRPCCPALLKTDYREVFAEYTLDFNSGCREVFAEYTLDFNSGCQGEWPAGPAELIMFSFVLVDIGPNEEKTTIWYLHMNTYP